jgi:hypothetical protein
VVTLLGVTACGGGGSGSARRPLGDAAIGAADVVARAGVFQQPVDAAPTTTGRNVYFVATGEQGPAVYQVPAGGGVPSVVAVGGPLTRPTNIVVSTDNSHVYVADPEVPQPPTAGAAASALSGGGASGTSGSSATSGASGRGTSSSGGGASGGAASGGGTSGGSSGGSSAVPGTPAGVGTKGAAGAGTGAILVVPVSGPSSTQGIPQAPTVVPGTRGLSPRGLDIVNQGDSDLIYFTGTDPSNGLPGLFEVSTAGGSVTTLAEGAPLVHPDSVAVTANGIAYVTDQGSQAGQGMLSRVDGGTVTPVLRGLTLGSPAGVVLVDNDATAVISSLHPTTLGDQLLFFEIATGKTVVAANAVGANMSSSGGLHRAHNASVLTFADTRGMVFRIRYS